MNRARSARHRVAVIAYTEYPYDMRIRREAETLARDGYDVSVIATGSGSSLSVARLGGVQIYELPLTIRRGGKIRYLYQYLAFFLMSTALLLTLEARKRFDLVHVHSLPDFQVFCAALLRIAGIPVILDLHEAMPEIFAARFRLKTNSLWFRAAVVLESISGRFANHVIVANDGIRNALVSRGMPVDRITPVYNVGDDSTEPVSPDELRHELGLPAGQIVVHAGGINPERDLETVIHAVSLLPTELDAHLVIAGDGDKGYIDSLRDLSKRSGLSERVLFVGRLTLAQAKCLMSMSSVGLVSLTQNPLTELAWPTRIVEFAHLRKPLLVADLPFIRSVLGGGARYYQPGDPRSLASEFRDLMQTPLEADKIVQQAERICRKFGLQEMRRNLLEVYSAAYS